MGNLGYRVIDADNHYYEPDDCYTRHIEAQFRDRAVHVVRGGDGIGKLFFGDQPLTRHPNNLLDSMGAPGALRAFFDGKSDEMFKDWEADKIALEDHPAFTSRSARLELMDKQGVEAAIFIPTLGVLAEQEMQHDVPALQANIRSFNRFVEEDWGFGADGRIFGVPMISLLDAKVATAELERVRARGARAIHLKASPAGGRSPADPLFDDFWARVEEANILAIFHVGDHGSNQLSSPAWGEKAQPSVHEVSAFQWYLAERTISDTLAALVLHNLFGRFPQLRVASLENGSSWVEDLLHQIDLAAKKGKTGRWIGGMPPERPSEIFRRHIYIAPFAEEDVLKAVELLGSKHILFGSDYPHQEGLVQPIDYLERIEGLPPEPTRDVMRDNTAALLGMSAA
jgi:predicted TIM-barrel fold metal-dependent hydrolase